MKKPIVFFLVSSFASLAAAAPETHSNAEIITVNDKTGTLKEERVQSIQTDITFTSAAGQYSLVELGETGNSEVDEHAAEENLSIPSWTLFSW